MSGPINVMKKLFNYNGQNLPIIQRQKIVFWYFENICTFDPFHNYSQHYFAVDYDYDGEDDDDKDDDGDDLDDDEDDDDDFGLPL